MRGEPEPKGVRAITYRNDAGETIPAYALIQLTGTTTVNGSTIWTADQWDGDDPEDVFYFNGPVDVADGKYGVAYSPHVPHWVKYDDADTPAFQDEWGPVANSYEIGVDGSGFIIMGGATDGKVLAVAKGGGCDDRNEKWVLTIGGTPTGGTFELDLNILGTTETMQFNFDDTSTEVQTELETHSEVASGDVTVSGGPFPDADMTIEFTGDLEKYAMDKPLIDFAALTGGSGVVVILQRWTPGHPKDGSVAP